MNIYFIRQPEDKVDWDNYDSAVVCAPDEHTAKRMDPLKGGLLDWDEERCYWCPPSKVECRLIGRAVESMQQGVICASYNT